MENWLLMRMSIVLKKRGIGTSFPQEAFPHLFKEVWGCCAKKGVRMAFPHQIKKAEPNSLNKVSIRLQEFPHWIVLCHCVCY